MRVLANTRISGSGRGGVNCVGFRVLNLGDTVLPEYYTYVLHKKPIIKNYLNMFVCGKSILKDKGHDLVFFCFFNITDKFCTVFFHLFHFYLLIFQLFILPESYVLSSVSVRCYSGQVGFSFFGSGTRRPYLISHI